MSDIHGTRRTGGWMGIKFELWQADIMVAEVEAPTFDEAAREIMHYAIMYGQDGPVAIKGKHAKRQHIARLRHRSKI